MVRNETSVQTFDETDRNAQVEPVEQNRPSFAIFSPSGVPISPGVGSISHNGETSRSNGLEGFMKA